MIIKIGLTALIAYLLLAKFDSTARKRLTENQFTAWAALGVISFFASVACLIIAIWNYLP